MGREYFRQGMRALALLCVVVGSGCSTIGDRPRINMSSQFLEGYNSNAYSKVLVAANVNDADIEKEIEYAFKSQALKISGTQANPACDTILQPFNWNKLRSQAQKQSVGAVLLIELIDHKVQNNGSVLTGSVTDYDYNYGTSRNIEARSVPINSLEVMFKGKLLDVSSGNLIWNGTAILSSGRASELDNLYTAAGEAFADNLSAKGLLASEERSGGEENIDGDFEHGFGDGFGGVRWGESVPLDFIKLPDNKGFFWFYTKPTLPGAVFGFPPDVIEYWFKKESGKFERVTIGFGFTSSIDQEQKKSIESKVTKIFAGKVAYRSNRHDGVGWYDSEARYYASLTDMNAGHFDKTRECVLTLTIGHGTDPLNPKTMEASNSNFRKMQEKKAKEYSENSMKSYSFSPWVKSWKLLGLDYSGLAEKGYELEPADPKYKSVKPEIFRDSYVLEGDQSKPSIMLVDKFEEPEVVKSVWMHQTKIPKNFEGRVKAALEKEWGKARKNSEGKWAWEVGEKKFGAYLDSSSSAEGMVVQLQVFSCRTCKKSVKAK